MRSQDAIEEQYREAANALVEKVQKDPYILAAIVGGSFSYAQVWEKSDLDVELIGRDAIRPTQSFFSFVENGVNIHASITPWNAFKQMIESAHNRGLSCTPISRTAPSSFRAMPPLRRGMTKTPTATTLVSAISSSKSSASSLALYQACYMPKNSFTSIGIVLPLFCPYLTQ